MFDEKTIEALKAEHGEVYLLEHEGAEVIVKMPDRPTWKRFRSAGADEKKRADAPEQLLKDCCVAPAKAELEALLAKRPGLAETFGGKLVEIAGLSDTATSRKL